MTNREMRLKRQGHKVFNALLPVPFVKFTTGPYKDMLCCLAHGEHRMEFSCEHLTAWEKMLRQQGRNR